MPSIDYRIAIAMLDAEFSRVETDALEGKAPPITHTLVPAFDAIFASPTQAYREVLIGCLVARLQSKSTDIRKPYIRHGRAAYNGRTLDEVVINPFLRQRHIPCSHGPFLATFRRSVMFVEATASGLRDKKGYAALLTIIDHASKLKDNSELFGMLRYLLYRFLVLRQKTDIPLLRIQRISLEQYRQLLENLLSVPSGGRFPVLLAEVTLLTVKEHFNLDWTIETQGINVADKPSGMGGDITVKKGSNILMVLEVTERPVDKNRIVATFQTKIAPHAIEDYLFLMKSSVSYETRHQARQYFSQGHEMNFLDITEWIIMTLATIGKRGRESFGRILIERLDTAPIPQPLKVAWNNQIDQLTSA